MKFVGKAEEKHEKRMGHRGFVQAAWK